MTWPKKIGKKESGEGELSLQVLSFLLAFGLLYSTSLGPNQKCKGNRRCKERPRVRQNLIRRGSQFDFAPKEKKAEC